MKKSRTQSEKLFSNEELTKTAKNLDYLVTMERLDKKYKISKIFRNKNFH